MTKRNYTLGSVLLLAVSCGVQDDSTLLPEDTTTQTKLVDSMTAAGSANAPSLASGSMVAGAGRLEATGAAGGAASAASLAQPTSAPGMLTTDATGVAGSQSPPQEMGSAAAPDSCITLALCCGALTDLSLRSTCESVSTSQAQAACAPLVEMLCNALPQTAAAQMSSPQTGSPGLPPADAAPSQASDPCASLMVCCSTLQDEEDLEDCQDTVDQADAALCSETLPDLCPDQSTTMQPTAAMPTSTTPAADDPCGQLGACCLTLMEDDQESCQQTVDGADAMMCGSALAELCPLGNEPVPQPMDD